MRPSEAQVSRRLLRNPALVAERSLREVAAELGTSDATVMRACRAAGFDGFQDLKYHVLREFTAGGGGDGPGSSNGDVSDPYADDVVASRRAAEANLDRAASLLRQASRVLLAGVGASRGVAMVAVDILFTLGRPALCLGDEQMAGYAFAPPVGGAVLLAISHSGETRFTVSMADEARRCGVKSIGVTNDTTSELARAVDVLLPTQAEEPPTGSFSISPRVCQLAVLDLLFGRLKRRRQGEERA